MFKILFISVLYVFTVVSIAPAVTMKCEVVKNDYITENAPNQFKDQLLVVICKDSGKVLKLKDGKRVKIKTMKREVEGC